MESARLSGLWSFKGRYKVLHLTWFAFFLTFVVWFNLAPFAKTIGTQLHLSAAQLGALALCNVALTVPARILIGMALDKFGPRKVYSTLLIYAAVPCVMFGLSSDFKLLVVSRLLLSIVGAGFVIGIRMVSEWFPPREIGMAEGVYGGWGNFGAAAAALTLPTVAGLAAGPNGWRIATIATGAITAVFGVVYYFAVSDTPDGFAYHRPKRHGALEVTSRAAVFGLAALSFPLVGVLGLLAWRLQLVGVLTDTAMYALWAGLALVYALMLKSIRRVNQPALRNAYHTRDRYPFRSVALLSAAYLTTFGSELAVVSMLPTFFANTWKLGPAAAGATASAFAFVNLVARPAGGLLSDVLGSRRRTLRILVGGLFAGYLLMAGITPAWPLALGVVAAMACSVFVQSGAGAVFAIVPLVKRRVTGQIAGMAGAYGNVGALLYLTVMMLWGAKALFIALAVSSMAVAFALRWLPEPENAFASELENVTAEPAAAVSAAAGVPAADEAVLAD